MAFPYLCEIVGVRLTSRLVGGGGLLTHLSGAASSHGSANGRFLLVGQRWRGVSHRLRVGLDSPFQLVGHRVTLVGHTRNASRKRRAAASGIGGAPGSRFLAGFDDPLAFLYRSFSIPEHSRQIALLLRGERRCGRCNLLCACPNGGALLFGHYPLTWRAAIQASRSAGRKVKPLPIRSAVSSPRFTAARTACVSTRIRRVCHR